MSNEKKIIKEMVQGNLKVHRKRNLLLVLAITLTTILFTSVLEIGFGGIQSIQETQLKLSGMKADAELRFLSEEQFQKTKDSNLFESVGGRVPIAFLEGTKKHPVEIDYFDKSGLESYYISLEEGNIPKKENEVIMSDKALTDMGIEAEIGTSIPVTFNLRDKEYSFDMILSGWYKGEQRSSYLIVSKKFLDNNPELKENSYNRDKEIAGTYYASVCMKNKESHIEQTLTEYAKSLGGQTEDFSAQDYINVSINPVLYSEDTETGISLTILFFGCLFVLCGYLLIYNIFDIGVMQDIQQFGMMKTIGMTGKQIKQLMRKQMLLLSLVGIPIGLIMGYGLGVLLLPVILKKWEYSEEELVVLKSSHPAIFLLTVIFVLITVFISMRKPSKKAARFSAIENTKYTEIGGKTAEKDINSIKNMAKSNLQRNRKRTIFTFTSLTLSIIFVNSLWSISNSFDEDKFVNARLRRDFLVASADTLNSSIGYVKESASLNEEAIRELEKNSMVQNSTRLYRNIADDSDISFDWGTTGIEIKEDRPNMERNGVVTNEAITNYGRITLADDERALCNVCGISEAFIDKMEIWDGEKNLDIIKKKLKSGNYILVASFKGGSGRPDQNMFENSPQIGEKVTIYKNGVPLKKLEVLSRIVVVPSERMSGEHGTGENTIMGPWLYLDEGLFKELYGELRLVNYSFDAEKTDFPAVKRLLNQMSQQFSDVGFETVEQRQKEIVNLKMLVRIVCVLIGGILGAIGVINLVNVIFTNLIVRNRELATFRSIGATKKQLRELIIRENIGYVIYATIGGLLLSTVLNITAINAICDTIWLLTFQFTLVPALIIAVLFLVVAMLVSEIGISLWEKESITERLRNE